MAWYGVMTVRELWQGHILFLLFFILCGEFSNSFLCRRWVSKNLMTLFPRYGQWLAMPVGVILFAVVHFPELAADACHGLYGLLFYSVVPPRSESLAVGSLPWMAGHVLLSLGSRA